MANITDDVICVGRPPVLVAAGRGAGLEKSVARVLSAVVLVPGHLGLTRGDFRRPYERDAQQR